MAKSVVVGYKEILAEDTGFCKEKKITEECLCEKYWQYLVQNVTHMHIQHLRLYSDPILQYHGDFDPWLLVK